MEGVLRAWAGLIAALPLLVACERPTVLVLALDGADWDVMDPLMDAGFLPAMRGVVEQGVRGEYDCAPAWPAIACYCPPVWASLATGHVFAVNGIGQAGQPPSDRRYPPAGDRGLGPSGPTRAWRARRRRPGQAGSAGSAAVQQASQPFMDQVRYVQEVVSAMA